MKKIKRKLLPKLLISWTLTFNISATECLIEIKFSVLDSADQALQHIPLLRKSKIIDLANRATLKGYSGILKTSFYDINQNIPTKKVFPKFQLIPIEKYFSKTRSVHFNPF